MCNLKKTNLLLVLFSSVMVCGEEDLKKIDGFATDGFSTEIEENDVTNNVENPLEEADDFENNSELTTAENEVINKETTTSNKEELSSKSKKPAQEITNPTAFKKKGWSTTAKVITGGLVSSLFIIPAGFKIKEVYDERDFNPDMVVLFSCLYKTKKLTRINLNFNKEVDDSDESNTPKLAENEGVYSFDLFEAINAYIKQKDLPSVIIKKPNLHNQYVRPEVVLTFGEENVVQKVRFHNAPAEEMFFKFLYYFAAKNVSQTAKYFKLIMPILKLSENPYTGSAFQKLLESFDAKMNEPSDKNPAKAEWIKFWNDLNSKSPEPEQQ